MTQVLVFTATAIVLYLLSDWILRMIEMKRGEVLKNRQVVFFVIILTLSVVTFHVLQEFLTNVS